MDLWWLVKCKFHSFCPSPQIWQKVVAWRKQWTWSLGSSLLSQLCSLSHTSFLPLSMLLSLWRNGGGWFDLPTSQGIKAKWVMHTWKGFVKYYIYHCKVFTALRQATRFLRNSFHFSLPPGLYYRESANIECFLYVINFAGLFNVCNFTCFSV